MTWSISAWCFPEKVKDTVTDSGKLHCLLGARLRVSECFPLIKCGPSGRTSQPKAAVSPSKEDLLQQRVLCRVDCCETRAEMQSALLMPENL